MIPRTKISKGGKVVIPAFLRKQLNIKEGEEVMFELQDEHVILTPIKHILAKARQTVNHYHPAKESLVDKLIAERRREAEHE